MVFTAALTAGVLQLLLIYGMLGITGTYRLAGNALRDLVLLLVCVVLLIVCTNYTWSKGHPASTISRGMGLFLCVRDNTFFNQFHNAVGEHLRVDAEVFLFC